MRFNGNCDLMRAKIHQSGLLTHIAATASVSLRERMKSLTAFLELERVMR
jgi:hypothetical protein